MRIILISVRLMEAWQILIQKAEYNLNHEQWFQAEESYHQAIQCIEQQWLLDIENIPLTLAWISTFHHLAVLYELQGKSQTAFKYLQIPHQKMTEFYQAQNYSEDFRLVILRGLKMTLSPLLAFTQKHHACTACLASIKKIEIAVNALQPVMH